MANELDCYWHVKKSDKKHYVALDMANGMTYVGREEVIVTKGTPFAIDDGETSNLEDAIIVETECHIARDGRTIIDPAIEYASLYRAWARHCAANDGVKAARLGTFGSNPHVVRVWDLGYDITDKL